MSACGCRGKRCFHTDDDDTTRLLHLVDGFTSPIELFPSGAYRETLPRGSPFPTLITWWENRDREKKLMEKLLEFDRRKRVTKIQWTIYDEDGATARVHVVDRISYVSVFEVSRTRTILNGESA